MNVCTVSQVNVCRHFISTYLSGNVEAFVTLVLHYPPEMNLSDQPNYHAIYVDNWNFVYIDSIGVTTGQDSNGGIQKGELKLVFIHLRFSAGRRCQKLVGERVRASDRYCTRNININIRER